MKTFILDSSVYISYLNPQDSLHEKTKKFINLITAPDMDFVVPIIVFLEVGNVLQKRLPQFTTENLMRFFEDHNVIGLNMEIAENLLAVFKKFGLKTSDAIILGTAILNNATLITWDEKLVKKARKLANVQTPTIFFNK